MKKILLISICVLQTIWLVGQVPDTEKHAIDSILKTGRLNSNQAAQLRKKWTSKDYYAFKANSINGEIEVTDILQFTNLEKKILFQRCKEWIAITYGNLVHDDAESGKIIANGSLDLLSYESQNAFGATRISPIQTPASYTLILTIKDNKIKYLITGISLTYTNLLSPELDITYPLSAIYPVNSENINWIRYYTSLNAGSEMFFTVLKTSLLKYVNDVGNDYSF